jgi:hypothetical protein
MESLTSSTHSERPSEGQRTGRDLENAPEVPYVGITEFRLSAAEYARKSGTTRVAGCSNPGIQRGGFGASDSGDRRPCIDALKEQFRDERRPDYTALIREIEQLKPASQGFSTQIRRLKRRLEEIAEIDFFDCPLRAKAEEDLCRAGHVERHCSGMSSCVIFWALHK